MTPSEFVVAIEDYWKPLTPKNQRLYINRAAGFNRDQLDRMYDELLDTCQWTPKIKDIVDTALDLGFLQKNRERRTLGEKGCRLCEETGFRYITEAVTMPDGVTFRPGEAVRRCECRRR